MLLCPRLMIYLSCYFHQVTCVIIPTFQQMVQTRMLENNLLQNDFRLNHSVLCLSSPLYQPRPTVPCFQYKIKHHCTYNNAQAWLYMNSYRSVLNVLFSMVNRSGRHCNLLDRCINQSQETEIEKTRSWQIVPCLDHALF